MNIINVLLIDDDPETLALLVGTLPTTLDEVSVRWQPCGDFDEAIILISERRFDIVVTDIYRDKGGPKLGPTAGDARGEGILAEIRNLRFCPVLMLTDGEFPPDIVEGPFLKLADKSHGNDVIVEKMKQLLETGVPELAQKLHDELDKTGGSYLWEFLESNWEAMKNAGLTEMAILDRLLRRRLAVQMGRLVESGDSFAEVDVVQGAEFYLNPSISSDLRLGQVMHRDGEYRVILTPHCHMVVQPNATAPRADYVLTALAVPAKAIFNLKGPLPPKETAKLDEVRRRIQSPAQTGTPEGRYWFIPGFLAMPHLYADFLQLKSVTFTELSMDWTTMAVLDVPFAEAFQSCFVRFYSAVGLPGLDPIRYLDLESTTPVHTE